MEEIIQNLESELTQELVVDAEGRIELPPDVREILRAEAGDHIRIRTLEDGTILLEPQVDFRTLSGILSNNGIHLTIEQINEVISTMGAPDDRN